MSRASEHDESIDPEPDGYAAAVSELEAILREIESADVDVDLLASRVERASALISWCRRRLVAAQDAVDAVTAVDATAAVDAATVLDD